MDAFRILCTTCQAGLKVRHASMVGQILPCPKCGSMVLIEEPSESAAEGVEATASQAAADPAFGSFDHIDELLDGDDSSAADPRSGGRWRSEDASTEATPSPEDFSRDAPELGSSDFVETDADSVPESDLDADSDAPYESQRSDWLNQTTSPLRGYLMVGVGALVGLTLATGLAIIVLRAKTQATKPPAVSTLPEEAADADEDREASMDDRSSDPDGDVGGAPNELMGPDIDISAAQSDVETSVAQEPDTQTGNAVGESEQLAQSNPLLAPKSDSGDTAEANSDPSTLAAEDNAPPVPNEPPLPNAAADAATTGDDLADFAAWLQNPDAASTGVEPSEVGEEAGSSPAVASDPTDPGLSNEPAIVPSKNPPAPVNVEARLKQPISAVRFRDVSLVEAIRLLTDLTTVPISIDASMLERRNLKSDVALTVTLTDASLEEVLDAITSKMKLGYRVQAGQIMITTRPQAAQKLVTARHNVADLVTGDAKQVEALATWIQDLIAPGSWEQNSDDSDPSNQDQRGQCSVDGTVIVVTHEDGVQFDVLALLEKLRRARQLPPNARVVSGRTELGSRTARFESESKIVELRSPDEMNFAELATAIERQTDGLRILIDWAALYSAGWTPDDRQRVFADKLPVTEALARVLHRRGLAYRVIDANTLEITTAERRMTEHDVEVYRLPSGVQLDAVKQLSERLVNALGPLKFEPQGRGAIAFDPQGEALIVSLPQPDQKRVQAMIDGFDWTAAIQ